MAWSVKSLLCLTPFCWNINDKIKAISSSLGGILGNDFTDASRASLDRLALLRQGLASS